MVSYLMKFSDAAIRFRTGEPDYSDLPDIPPQWNTTIYGDVKEELPDDFPTPLGRFVMLTHYVDANLYHDWITGRSVTGILTFMNQTPIDWFSKKQATVESATYGSEFVATRICVDKSVDLRTTLRYLGVPVRSHDIVFGDNESVVNSSMRIDAKLHKRHNMLCFHRVRQAIASGFIKYYHVPGKSNYADILSKHWGYADVWDLLRPLLYWEGDTAHISTSLKTNGGPTIGDE
jgi:hypothetical protein